jgi:hypothetical protein
MIAFSTSGSPRSQRNKTKVTTQIECLVKRFGGFQWGEKEEDPDNGIHSLSAVVLYFAPLVE